MILQKCDDLKWSEELKRDCIYVVERITQELQGCHALTITGVALYLLNSRITADARTKARFAEFKRPESQIADVVEKGLANIKDKYEQRIKE